MCITNKMNRFGKIYSAEYVLIINHHLQVLVASISHSADISMAMAYTATSNTDVFNTVVVLEKQKTNISTYCAMYTEYNRLEFQAYISKLWRIGSLYLKLNIRKNQYFSQRGRLGQGRLPLGLH